MRSASAWLSYILLSLWWLVLPGAYAGNLSEIITQAIIYHPQVRSQMAQIESSEFDVEVAKWQFYPTPGITLEGVDRDNSNRTIQGDDYVSTFSLNQPLWTGGRIRAGVDIAEAGLNESYARLDGARQSVALRVVAAYGEWMSAYFQYNYWQTSLETHERLRDQVARRVEEGASSESDLGLAEGRLESTRAEVATVYAQQEIALARLEQLAGRRYDSAIMANDQSEKYSLTMDLQLLRASAEEISPLVNEALAQLNISEAQIVDSKAELKPEVYLSLEHQRGDFDFPNFGNENRITIGISSRFGAGFSSIKRVDASKLRRQAALSEVESQRLAVAEQVITDYALLTSFDTRIRALSASVEIAVDVSESYSRQFLAGRKSWLDVMNAARDLVNTEIQLADAKASQIALTWRLAVISFGVDAVMIPESNTE